MASILEGLESKRTQCSLTALLVGFSSAANLLFAEDVPRNEWKPPGQEETRVFLQDTDIAFKSCGYGWFEKNLMSIWTVTYQVDDELPIIVGHDRYLDWFEKSCITEYTMSPYNEWGFKFRMEKDWSVVTFEVGEGAFGSVKGVRHFTKINPKNIKSIRWEEVLIRNSNYDIKHLRANVFIEKY